MMTKHSQLRMKQRMGYRGAAAERIVNNAMERGYTAETAPTSWQQNYLQRKASPGYSVVLYQDRCFVFAEQKCITVSTQIVSLALYSHKMLQLSVFGRIEMESAAGSSSLPQ